MAVTYWLEIRKLQDEIKNGNSTIIVKFLEFLIKNKVSFRGQLLTDICESVVKPGSSEHYFPKEVENAWSLLHDFADNYYKEEKWVEKPC
jgi:hypothetical protein